ncbi:subtilase family protein [Nitrosospira sp. Nsp5]|uniref:Subtilase family protein n=1 Tax=Nitrosospira multiformis TaxID=1231 RepID=A0ABY0TIW1_9PROT|nr:MULTISPECIES: S8 family serine peptidase [Nitrosospira]PTR06767.1 subtilase family protein [Nitrosospira sp. Nsp5]SDQ87741.1 Subtilase family protein [Nitrosospira multiformis]
MNINKRALPAAGVEGPAAGAATLTLSGFFGSRRLILARHGVAAFVLTSCMTAPVVSNAAPPEDKGSRSAGSETWAKGRILVMPRAGLPEKELAKILGAHGGKARKIGQSDLYIVDLPGNASEKAVAARLARHPHLKLAEPDYRDSPELVPNDPYYGSAWHLPKIGAPAAWDSSQGAGVTIAILDSGVDSAHPDLATRLVPGWNFYDNNSNTSDVFGHGTKVAGAAAAAGNNGIGVTSVAGQSKIMPIRVTDVSGGGYTSMIANGLIYAADRGIRVASISFANQPSRPAVVSAAQYMKDKGGLVIVAAGNNGINENFTPTTAMIPVSATDGNDVRASWSSYGTFVAMAAPGTGIWTTSKGGGYGAVSGTSVSSPVTAGVVALMMAAKPALPNTQVESLLYSTAVDLGAAGRDAYYGYGRVNAARAIKAAVGATQTADTQVPAVSISAPLGGATVTGLVGVNVTATDNVGVTRVELRVNSATVAIDTSAPFGFTWNSAGTPNGMSNLVAYAFDAAGNSKASAAVAVNVANGTVTVPKDTTAPVVKIINPVAGNISSNVAISLNATDNSGAAGITQTVYIDGVLKATGSGSTLGYNWNTRTNSVTAGTHTIRAVAKDKAGNASSASVNVMVIK